jgi:hypothetical protein
MLRIPMSPSRASARTIFREHANADLELSSIACMIEGTPAITITLAIQKPRRP